MRANNIKNGEIDLGDVQYVSRAKVKPSQLLRKGDILVCASSGSRSLVGKAALIKEDMSATFGAFCCVIRSLEGESSYLGHYFQSDAYRRKIEHACSGSNINNLKADCFFDLRVPVHEVETRGLIVRQLDALRTQIKMSQKQLSALDDLVKSRFVEMFGDPIYNEKGYPEKRLGELLEIARGGSPRPIKDYLTNDPEGINWIKIGDTVEGSRYINSTAEKIKPEGKAKSREVKAGDFLLSNSMSFGRPYILNIDGCIHDGWLVLSDSRKRFNKVFLCELLGSSALKAKFSSSVRGGVVNNLNIDLVASTVVPYPPLALQQQFADFVARVDKLGFDSCGDAFSACRLLLVKGLAGGVQDGEGPSRRGSVHKDEGGK
ncbi:restriction endonuclease subunit S [Olsenella uli]|uniref:restriction endonuclease subunit S n=1 Tax=Olsenella uli TaxID=133926 RepID=UPI003D797FE5